MPGIPTTTALQQYANDLSLSIGNDKRVDVTSFDFKKTFDSVRRVSHRILQPSMVKCSVFIKRQCLFKLTARWRMFCKAGYLIKKNFLCWELEALFLDVAHSLLWKLYSSGQCSLLLPLNVTYVCKVITHSVILKYAGGGSVSHP